MIEVLDTQVIPMAATAAGLYVGYKAEGKAIERAATERQSLAEAWSLEQDEQDGEQAAEAGKTKETPSRFKQLTHRVGRYATALTVSAGLAAGLTAEAWLPLTEHADQQQAPALEVVVDHSGATALPLNGKPALTEINQVVSQLEGIEDIDSEAWLAGSGETKPVQLAAVKSAPAFGDAPLEQGVNAALGRAGFASAKRQNHKEHAASVVVITNGNDIGSPQAVTAEAKSKDTPVFVINVEGSESDAAHGLQKIAKQTHGKYWDVHQNNLDTVARDVKKTITTKQHEAQAKPVVTDGTQTMLRFLSVMSLIGVGVGFAQRRKTPFQRNLRGE